MHGMYATKLLAQSATTSLTQILFDWHHTSKRSYLQLQIVYQKCFNKIREILFFLVTGEKNKTKICKERRCFKHDRCFKRQT